MQPGDVPVTYADVDSLIDAVRPVTPIEDGLKVCRLVCRLIKGSRTLKAGENDLVMCNGVDMDMTIEDVLRETAVGERDWGRAMLHVCSGSYTFKLLKIHEGSKGGLQYHRLKDECAFVVSGDLLVRYDLNDGQGLQERILSAGAAVRFWAVHQRGFTDVTLIEASAPHLNDRVRGKFLWAARGLWFTNYSKTKLRCCEEKICYGI